MFELSWGFFVGVFVVFMCDVGFWGKVSCGLIWVGCLGLGGVGWFVFLL